jgi:hypothetical protein
MYATKLRKLFYGIASPDGCSRLGCQELLNGLIKPDRRCFPVEVWPLCYRLAHTELWLTMIMARSLIM